jgi:hypothetical protein
MGFYHEESHSYSAVEDLLLFNTFTQTNYRKSAV